MKLKAVPLLVILISGTTKLLYSLSTRSHFDIISGVVISLCFVQITWAYWKDKDMLAPPNFNFKNGDNGLPRTLFVVSMLICYLMFVVGA
jgi:hypothetical protein